MKTYLRNYKITKQDVFDAYAKWSKSKSGRKNGHIVDSEYHGYASMCDEIYRELMTRNLSFRPIRYYERVEPTNGKVRTIGVQSVKQQVCDYLAVMLLQPMLDARLGFYQCASVPAKGQVFAMKRLRKWYDEGGYFVKLDVVKCYPSVDQRVLMRFLGDRVGSDDALYLFGVLLSTYGEGLNIGSYFSQYMANLVLSEAYHYVESLNKTRRGKARKLVAHQLWYMDDCIMFSRCKRDLSMAARAVEAFMGESLHLRVKPWKVSRCGFDQLDMVGYVMRPSVVRLRKSTFRRARRAFARFGRAPCMKRACRVVSYWGFLKWTSGKFCASVSRIFKEARRYISRRTLCTQQVLGLQTCQTKSNI